MTTHLVFASSATPFWVEHPTVTRLLVIAAFFAFGYLEGPMLKLRTSACVSWMMGLLLLTGWIAYSFRDVIGLVLAFVVLVAGVAVIAGYYRQASACSVDKD